MDVEVGISESGLYETRFDASVRPLLQGVYLEKIQTLANRGELHKINQFDEHLANSDTGPLSVSTQDPRKVAVELERFHRRTADVIADMPNAHRNLEVLRRHQLGRRAGELAVVLRLEAEVVMGTKDLDNQISGFMDEMTGDASE